MMSQIKSGDKLYIVTRKDLTPGQQISQSLHVFREFVNQYNEIENDWYNNSNYICILSANDESHLNDIIEKCMLNKVKFSIFKEPDYNDSITSIAIEPGLKSKKITSSLPLALKCL